MNSIETLEKLTSDGSEAYIGTIDRKQFLRDALQFFLSHHAADLLAHVKQLEADKKRMEEALRFYGDANGYILVIKSVSALGGHYREASVIKDGGQRARECLKGKRDE